VAVVSDPQLTDAYSYKQSPGTLLHLTEHFSDVYMRKAYSLMQVRGGGPPMSVSIWAWVEFVCDSMKAGAGLSLTMDGTFPEYASAARRGVFPG